MNNRSTKQQMEDIIRVQQKLDNKAYWGFNLGIPLSILFSSIAKYCQDVKIPDSNLLATALSSPKSLAHFFFRDDLLLDNQVHFPHFHFQFPVNKFHFHSPRFKNLLKSETLTCTYWNLAMVSSNSQHSRSQFRRLKCTFWPCSCRSSNRTLHHR